MNVSTRYSQLCLAPSDINEHLPTLCRYASECESVLELGVRGCVSSWAFAQGLLSNNKPVKKLFLNDIVPCDIAQLVSATNSTKLELYPIWMNDLHLTLNENVDLTFIDTWHVYGQLKRELEKFSKVTNKYIVLHDTTVDELFGESLRCGMNVHDQSVQSGFPVEEIIFGLWKAVEEFLEKNQTWKLKERYTNNNGLTVLVNTIT